MAITRTRHTKVVTKPWEVILSHIDRVTADLHDAFIDAFSGGLEKPQGLDLQRRELFRDIWDGLSKLDLSTFESIEELNTYYSSFIQNLDYYILDYCRIEKLTEDAMPQQRRDVLKTVAQIYFALAKQKFILKMFQHGVEVSSLSSFLDIVKNECERLEKESAVIKPDEIEKTLMDINILFNEVIEGFKSKGFGDIETEFSSDNLSKSSQVDLVGVRTQLERIPSVTEINKIIDRLHTANQSGNDDELKNCRTELKQVVKVTEDVIDQLGNAISENLRSQAIELHSLLQQCDLLQEKFQTLNAHFDKVDVFHLIVQLYGYKNNNVQIDNSFRELNQLANVACNVCEKQLTGIATSRDKNSKAWIAARDKATNLLPVISAELRSFVLPYGKYIKTFQDLNLRVSSLNEKKEKVDVLRMLWAARLKKAEDAWQKCCEAAYRAQENLLTHAESSVDYIKSFLSHHKLKMIFGGLSGSGTGVTLSGLLFAFEAAATSVLVGSGAVVGIGAAAMVGVGIEHYRRSKVPTDDLPSVRHGKYKKQPSMFVNLSNSDSLGSQTNLDGHIDLTPESISSENVQADNQSQTSSIQSHSLFGDFSSLPNRLDPEFPQSVDDQSVSQSVVIKNNELNTNGFWGRVPLVNRIPSVSLPIALPDLKTLKLYKQ